MKKRYLLILSLAITMSSVAIANATTVVGYDMSTTSSIPALTAFDTTGAMMDGMQVTATFANGVSETSAIWAATGAESGGAIGASGWSLSLDGSSFRNILNPTNPGTNPWVLDTTNFNGSSNIASISVNGMAGNTVFDVWSMFTGNTGTPGSEYGEEFTVESALGYAGDFSVEYSNQIALGASSAVGDLYGSMTISFDQTLGSRSFIEFWADTDNIETANTPEPATMLLLGTGLSGLAALRRRKVKK